MTIIDHCLNKIETKLAAMRLLLAVSNELPQCCEIVAQSVTSALFSQMILPFMIRIQMDLS